MCGRHCLFQPKRAAVVIERIWRAVDDSHYGDLPGEIEAVFPECPLGMVERGAGRTRLDATRCPKLQSYSTRRVPFMFG
jgi:hypothetical protein